MRVCTSLVLISTWAAEMTYMSGFTLTAYKVTWQMQNEEQP